MKKSLCSRFAEWLNLTDWDSTSLEQTDFQHIPCIMQPKFHTVTRKYRLWPLYYATSMRPFRQYRFYQSLMFLSTFRSTNWSLYTCFGSHLTLQIGGSQRQRACALAWAFRPRLLAALPPWRLSKADLSKHGPWAECGPLNSKLHQYFILTSKHTKYRSMENIRIFLSKFSGI
jgi:hypothetical protein